MQERPNIDFEWAVRQAAIDFVLSRAERNGGVVSRSELEAFEFEGEQIKLIDQSRGIRNPRQLMASVSIMSSDSGPYEDVMDPASGLMRYAYRAGSPDAGDNVKLRRAADLGVPVILLKKIADAVFVPIAPVFFAQDHPEDRFIAVSVDEPVAVVPEPSADHRRYVERVTRLRLHQPVFRAQVIRAYEKKCAICRLKLVELLEAAHILADADGGQPSVTNGVSLCKIHHAAYDNEMLSLTPDYRVMVRPSLMRETDGPMLRHGLQDIDGWHLHLPPTSDHHPDRDALATRHQQFLCR